MQLPNLPTDNLYKFLAISGIIIISLSMFFPVWLNYNLTLKAMDVEEELDIMNIETKYFRIEFRDGKVVESKDKMKENAIKLAKISSKNKKIEYLHSKVESMKLLFIIGTGVGFVLVCYGFSLWYMRLQRYQDKIIKRESEK